MKRIIFFLLFFILLNICVFGQERVSDVERIEREIERERILRKRLEKEKEIPEIEEERLEVIPPSVKEEKVFIKEIKVVGVTLLSQKEIKKIISNFENKELTLRDLQKICDLITDLYRKKGYITSRAYLPPQKIEEGILEIRVLEGVTGDLEIKGNRYFKTQTFKKKITLKKGEPFNYNILRKNLSEINALPDRKAKAVLMPGKEPGQTDIILEVKDRLPIHIGFVWDNFGSRYIEKDRYRNTLTHNNLLGLEDRLTLQYQLAEADTYWLTSLHYLLPLSEDLDIGFSISRTKLDLGREYKDLNARGKSRIYSIYLIQSLIKEENIILTLNLGFDYKDIFNFQLYELSSLDRLRVVRIGLDLDLTDKFGRTIITNELDFGIPNIMGGLKEKDSSEQLAEASKGKGGSRAGSGGKFIKNTINLLRLQRMPFNSTLLWKNQIQLSPYILTATEQFQIGGISNVRGYPSAEYTGDKGYTTTLEWSFPLYFLPKRIKVPFSRVKLYDTIRVVAFYDWANVGLRRPQPGEEKKETLSSVGFGLRFNLPEDFFDFSIRADFGWPLGKIPPDKKHFHPWIEISKSF